MSTIHPTVWLSRQRLPGLLLLSAVTGLATFYLVADQSTTAPVELPVILLQEASTTEPTASLTESQKNLALCELLDQAEQTLSADNTAEAEFHKRERVRGKLQGPNVIQLKVRRTPLSVYMRWQAPDEGQEVIWQENANDSKILAHPGGWRRKIVPLMKIDPLGERALASGRRPINTIGIWNFNRRLVDFVAEQRGKDAVQVDVSEVSRAGRDCWRFRFVQPQYAAELDFQQVLIFIDRQRTLPLALEHYGWPAGGVGEPLLEESYAFVDLRLGADIRDADFDVTNPNYEFRR